MLTDINDDNFLIYCAKAYSAPRIIQSDFEDEIRRIKYIKRLLRKYRETGELKERLLLNHIIILANVFSPKISVNILFFKLEEQDFPVIKSILLFLNYLPEILEYTYNGKYINLSSIPLDDKVVKLLREL